MKSSETTEISLVAIDWGTTSFRLYLLSDGGGVIAEATSKQGIAGMAGVDFESFLIGEISKLVDGPVIPEVVMCGMVGSNIGWLDAGYVGCPVSLADLAAKRVKSPSQRLDAYIVPGLKCESPLGEPDFMRGEETQILGWLAEADDSQLADSFICLPGTHTKWVHVIDGGVMGFNTSYTGALYQHFCDDSVLVHGDQQASEAASYEGLCLGLKTPVISQTLFSVRSRVLDGSLPVSAASSFLSGLLVGSDVRSAVDTWSPIRNVIVIGEAEIARLYCQALRQLSIEARYFDGKQAVVRGLRAIATESRYKK